MSYTALYREWRPQTFSQVVGQEHVVRTLRNAIRDDQLSHAYLFSGPRGTGKTSIARILAKAINCDQGPTDEPCGNCVSCQGIASGSAMDVIEIDAASNRGINEIRDLREKVRYAPAHSRNKVYIIDEIHMLTTEAFNALLKTLEDPPGHVSFLMATTEAHKIPLTILSRLQRFDFHRLKTSHIAGRLREICDHNNINVDDATLRLIALQADGALRDALSLLDQCRSFSGDTVTSSDVSEVLGTVGTDVFLDLGDRILSGDLAGCLLVIERAEGDGRDLHVMTRDLLGHFRNLMLINVSAEAIASVGDELMEKLKEQAGRFTSDRLLTIIDTVADMENRMRHNPQPRLLLEVALMKLVLGQDRTEGQGAQEHKPQKATSPPRSRKPDTEVQSRTRCGSSPARNEMAAATEMATREPEAVPVGESTDQDQLWASFRERVRGVRRGLHALLEPARLLEIEGNRFVIGFPGQYTFHRDRTEESSSYLNKILSQVVGKECRIACRLLEEEAGGIEEETWPEPEPDPVVDGPRTGSSPIQAALEMFDGELVDERNQGGR